MNQRRSSFVVLSVTAHAIVLGALLATSLLAPGCCQHPERCWPGRPNAWCSRWTSIFQLLRDLEHRRHRRIGRLSVLKHRRSLRPSKRRRASHRKPVAKTSLPVRSTASARSNGRRIGRGIGIAERPPTAPPAPIPQGPQRLHQGIQAPRKMSTSRPDIQRSPGIPGSKAR